MALSSTGFDYLTPLLKNYYTTLMIDAAKLQRYIINYLEKNQQVEPMGQNAVVPVIIAWAESVSPGTATSPLPAALDPEGATFTVNPRHLYGTLRVWHTEAKYADKDIKAFIKAQQTKLETITKALQAEAEIYCYGDGGVTPRAVCTAAVNNNGVVTLTCNSTRLLRRGMPLDFYTPAGSPIANGTYVQVKAILGPTQFTVDVGAANGAAFATAAADAHVYHANGKGKEPYGLEALIGTANNNIFGIDRSLPGNEWYVPLVYKIDQNGNLVTTTGPSSIGTSLQSWEIKYLYQIIETLITQKQAPKNKLAIFTTPSIMTKVVEDYRARGNATPPSKEIDVWPEETVLVYGVPIISSYLCRPGAIYIPCLNTFTKFETDPFSWDEVGGMWKQVYSGGSLVDAKEAYFREIYQLAVGDATQSATIYDCEGAYD